MKFRWGIAGTGRIAGDFVDGLRQVPDAEVVAVCSRSESTAKNFALQRNIPRWHGSYEALAADSNVDVLYVATPNSRHRSDTEMYLRAGKHVLCEKPFALNEIEAKSMYVRMNPVRAGLVAHPEDWPYRGEREGANRQEGNG